VLAATRVAMGIHYPTDVLAGAAVGALAALALHLRRARALLHRLADLAGAVLDSAANSAPTRRGTTEPR
jgi:undecaprenyl-diphosphatase